MAFAIICDVVVRVSGDNHSDEQITQTSSCPNRRMPRSPAHNGL